MSRAQADLAHAVTTWASWGACSATAGTVLRARSPRLLDQVRERIQYLHYSIRTEDAYVQWPLWSTSSSVCKWPTPVIRPIPFGMNRAIFSRNPSGIGTGR